MSATEISELITPLAPCLEILEDTSDEGASRSGYATAELPQTVVLGADLHWLGKALDTSAVSMVLARREIIDMILKRRGGLGKPVLMYEDPAESFYFLHNLGIHRRCYQASDGLFEHSIAPSAQVHASAVIEAPVRIDAGAVIGPMVVVRANTHIGRETVIHEACTLGSQGLFTKVLRGRPEQIAFFGGVKIGARCRIHAGVNICRAVNFGTYTTLADEVCCGPQSNIGHDGIIEEGAVLSCKVATMGRAHIGPGAWLGAGAMVSNGVKVGRDAKIRIGAVVIRDVKAEAEVSGNFASDHHKNLRKMF